MDNNLPNDPSNSNGSPPQTPPQPPSQPPPRSPPISPQNLPEYPNSPHTHFVLSEQAKHKLRDTHGRFAPTILNISIPPVPLAHSGGSGNDTGKDDDNLAEFKLKNPFSRFLNFLTRFIKNQNVKITIPAFTFIGLIMAASGGGGIITGALIYFFPHNSPVLHREVVYQGDLQITDKGFFLTLPNSDLYTLRPKAKSSINFQSLQDGPALVKGNLTVEKFVIDVTEIIPLNLSNSLPVSTSLAAPPAPTLPDSSNTPDVPNLPELYQKLTWETSQTKILTFTSGKRRINQEGAYFESAQLNAFPYDFINYYISQLQDGGFKQTLNKIDPDGITTSFEKDGIFLTFGVKNIYKGSGDNKKITGYKAFIEHN